MAWKQERDLLIAQTMAFVQSVTEERAATDRGVEPVSPNPTVTPEPSRETSAPPMRPSPLNHSDLREEIQSRVTAFRARQQLFNRDRDQYFNATLAKAHAVNEQATEISDNPRLKR